MPPRPNKRQLREQEELASLQVQKPDEASGDDDEEEFDDPITTKPKAMGFASLSVAVAPEEENDGDEEDGPAKSSKKSKKKKKKKSAAVVEAPAAEDVSPPPALIKQTAPAAQPVSKKADKKAKARQKKAEKESFESALAELSVKYPDMQNPTTSTTSPTSASLAKLLAVSLPHLNSDAELRKFFGAKVIDANKPVESAPTGRRGRRMIALQSEQQRSSLTAPKVEWARARQQREGLSARALDGDEMEARNQRRGWQREGDGDGDVWYTVEYNRRYKRLVRRFLEVVASGDPAGFYQILYHFPWQVDTILQQADIARHREEHSVAAELLSRALFSYELPLQLSPFTFTSGLNRLDFDHVENRPFYLAVHRHIIDITRRGLLRTGFEFAKLMYSLDPWDDPHGAAMWLEWLAVKAKMEDWFLEMFEWFDARVTDARVTEPEKNGEKQKNTKARKAVNLAVLPGWVYTRAVVLKMKEDEAEKKGRAFEGKLSSSDALKDAIVNFPQVVSLLADKADISLSGNIRSRPEFKICTDSQGLSIPDSIVHLLSHLYVQRAHGLWKDPSISTWFRNTLTSLLSHPPLKPPPRPRYTLFQTIYNPTSPNQNPRYSIYRHVTVFLQSSAAPNRALSGFIPHTTDKILASSLSCDPVPPPSYITTYNNEFFADVSWGSSSDPFSRGEGGGEDEGVRRAMRVFEGLFGAEGARVIEPMVRGNPELVDLIEAIGEGQVELLDVLNDAMVQAAAQGGAQAHGQQVHGHVPGAFGEDDEDAAPGAGGVGNGAGVGVGMQGGGAQGGDMFHGMDLGIDFDEDDGVDGDEGDEDEDDDEGGSTPFNMIRNVMSRFWPGSGATRVPSDSEDEDGPGPANG